MLTARELLNFVGHHGIRALMFLLFATSGAARLTSLTSAGFLLE